MHLFQLFKDAIRTKKWIDKFRVFYKHTGWRPEDVSLKYPIEITTNPYKQIKYQTQSTYFLTFWSLSQLLLHFAIQYHIIHLLPKFHYQELIVYALFCLVSIFSYTSLMDRHWLSIPLELTKLILGVYLLFYNGEIFNISPNFSISETIIYSYLFVSLIITIIYSTKTIEQPKMIK